MDENRSAINWFPGHMAKTRRMIKESLGSVDMVIEILDARIPRSSENPEFSELFGQKPVLVLLNKSSLADPDKTKRWSQSLSYGGRRSIATDCISGEGIGRIVPAIREMMAQLLERYSEKGMSGRRIRAMVAGIPNVGKSTLINRLSSSKKAKAEDRPGVTQTRQWVIGSGIELLDMPGMLWPRFEDRVTGENLALTGAIKDSVLNTEELACTLCGKLRSAYSGLLCGRYRLESAFVSDPEVSDWDLLTAIGRKRGFLVSGGETDTERTSVMFLDEFRGGRIGRISLELPE